MMTSNSNVSFQTMRSWLSLSALDRLYGIQRMVCDARSLLTCVLGFSCAIIAVPALMAAIYPIELEPREGTNWLHALALSRGVDIFDPTAVAYININHGPIDAIAKSFIISMFPYASASLVTRCFCILLPITIFATGLLVLRDRKFPILKALSLTFITYGLIVLNPTYGSFVGRSDPTALCFGFLAATVMLTYTKSTRANIFYPGVVGILLSLMVLTNWRFILIVPFMFIVWWAHIENTLRLKISTHVSCFAGLVGPPVFVFHRYYSWDIALYSKHYFGFFEPDSGWGYSLSDLMNLYSL